MKGELQEAVRDIVAEGGIEPLCDGDLQRSDPTRPESFDCVPSTLACVLVPGKKITLEDRVTHNPYGEFFIVAIGVVKRGEEFVPGLKLKELGAGNRDFVMDLYDLLQRCMINGTDVHHRHNRAGLKPAGLFRSLSRAVADRVLSIL